MYNSGVYEGVVMVRTQIYFDEILLDELKQQSTRLGVSVSAYIREVLKKDLSIKKDSNIKQNLAEFVGIWKEKNISEEEIKKQAWER
ncbi:MAG: Unknown protein [uncultured Campylobacterales bacterium]|uniref:Predicted DNA-binding protein ribbon-helix-helix domain-containing protein n=1 Tax=uncultured Campylobacterales bacterium TaxID=352960 RepID=A0A6S6SKF6_9BACT|nr:MAG: Unknown protein [uncultured Campylobacterales bacterium]